jgi:hypothetical protein
MPPATRIIGRAQRFGAVLAVSAIAALIAGSVHAQAAGFPPTSGYTVPTPPTAAQVNAAVLHGVEYIDCHQNANGSFGNGTTGDVPETAAAIIGYGTLDKGNIANLPTNQANPAATCPAHNYRTDLTNAVRWLLGQQDTIDPISSGANGGSWSYFGDTTYGTGLSLTALAAAGTVPTTPATAIATAIAKGRSFLENEFQGPPNVACTTAFADPTSFWCGGWNYDASFGVPGTSNGHSDESNTGFALTGLHSTGGVPASIRLLNLGWQNDIQANTTTNPGYAGTKNDGGGSYEPGVLISCSPPSFCSNANNTGSIMFGFADDGLTSTDLRVRAGAQLATDVLDTYEKAAHSAISSSHTMVFHTGLAEDGSCDPAVGGCDWALGSGEGGYHYSMFTLTKGLSSFIPANLADGTNWYAKIADLLVRQQDGNTANTTTFGSWPADTRDDFTPLFATGLSIASLGLAAAPPPAVSNFAANSYFANGGCTAVRLTWTNPSSPNYGGLTIVRRTDRAPTSHTDGTVVANVNAPGNSFNDTGLPTNATFFYGGFPYDTTRQVFGPASRATANTITCANQPIPVPNTGSTPGPGGLAMVVVGVLAVLVGVRRRP